MSSAVRKIEEYLAKNPGKDKIPSVDTLVLVTDSKGRYLQSEVGKVKLNKPNLIWLYESGRNTEKGVKAVEENIDSLSKKGNVLILFWHGTCDITDKQGKHIFQRHHLTEDLISTLRPSFDKLVQLNDKYDNVNIGLLEVPPIFSKTWNRQKGYEFADLSSDFEIHQQSQELNKVIREFNSVLSYNSPQLENDFIVSRRKRKRTKREVENKTRYDFTDALLKDGIHPISIVAQKWLHKIINSVLQDTLDAETGAKRQKLE